MATLRCTGSFKFGLNLGRFRPLMGDTWAIHSMGPHAVIDIIICVRLHIIMLCTRILVPSSFDQNALCC